MLRSVQIRTKIHSFFRYFCEFFAIYILHSESKRKNLKSSRIRQNRNINIHKFVQTTKMLNHITPRAQITMIIIHEHNLRTNRFDLINRGSLDSTSRPYRHKNRRLNHAMWRNDSPSARRAISRIQLKRKFFKHIHYFYNKIIREISRIICIFSEKANFSKKFFPIIPFFAFEIFQDFLNFEILDWYFQFDFDFFLMLDVHECVIWKIQ